VSGATVRNWPRKDRIIWQEFFFGDEIGRHIFTCRRIQPWKIILWKHWISPSPSLWLTPEEKHARWPVSHIEQELQSRRSELEKAGKLNRSATHRSAYLDVWIWLEMLKRGRLLQMARRTSCQFSHAKPGNPECLLIISAKMTGYWVGWTSCFQCPNSECTTARPEKRFWSSMDFWPRLAQR